MSISRFRLKLPPSSGEDGTSDAFPVVVWLMLAVGRTARSLGIYVSMSVFISLSARWSETKL